MKRINWIVFLMMLSLLIIGCGSGGGSGSDDTAGNEESLSQPANINSVNNASDDETNNPSLDDEKINNGLDNITVVVNQSYASAYLDYEKKIKDIEKYLNDFLNRNEGNKIQMLLDEPIVYSEEQINDIYNGKKILKSSGKILILYFYGNGLDLPDLFKKNGKNGFYRDRIFSNGNRVGEMWLAIDIRQPSAFTNLFPMDDGYEFSLETFLHEWLHSCGLAKEETYRTFIDSSGMTPNLGPFCYRDHEDDLYNDPMFGSNVPFKLSSFNSWWINNRNPDDPIKLPEKIEVLVVDESGNLVEGAEVYVFAASWGSVLNSVFLNSADPLLLLETKTGNDSKATINIDDGKKSTHQGLTFKHDFSVNVSAKIIKVYYKGQYAGAFLTLRDLEIAKLKNNQNVYTVQLRLEWYPF